MALNQYLATAAVTGLHRGGVAGCGAEVPDRVVAPVVGQPPLEQELFRHVLVHRQQFHRGNAQPTQVFRTLSWASPA